MSYEETLRALEGLWGKDVSIVRYQRQEDGLTFMGAEPEAVRLTEASVVIDPQAFVLGEWRDSTLWIQQGDRATAVSRVSS